MKRLYTTGQAAEYMGISKWTVRDMVRSGKLPTIDITERTILIDIGDMDELIEAAKVIRRD